MTGKLSQGQAIAGGAALLLIASLFLTWIGFDVPDTPELPEGAPSPEELGVNLPDVDDSVTAWDGSTLDIYLAITAAVALLPALLALTGLGPLPFPAPAVAFVLGAMGVILVVAFLTVDFPEGDGIDRGIGAFLGLAATLGITFGSYRTMQDEAAALDPS